MVTLEVVRADTEVETYIRQGHEHLGAIGFTEHSLRHAGLVARIAHSIMSHLDFPDREAELAAIAGYLHDIGNVISRQDHGQTGAVLAFDILRRLGMPPHEVARIVGAIGNHEEEYGQPVNNVSAALILADKSDVHRSRVRNPEPAKFDPHDRINYAVNHSFVRVDRPARTITLELTIDTTISPVMEYFEIFLTRMIMCRRAADFLGCRFALLINDVSLL